MFGLGMKRKKPTWRQFVFSFIREPELRPLEATPFPEPVTDTRPRCKEYGCIRPAARGKAYCSKAHSPYGLLQDEPDDAPIEWTPPVGFYKWNPHKMIG